MTDKRIGELAEKYETSGRGPGYISNGDKWDPGGDSYGSYQLATKVGTLQAYLRTNLPYVAELNKYKIKSESFNQQWKAIAANDPEGFKQSQFDFVCTISYNPARRFADRLGWPDTLAINSALFSVSNQHGGWKIIMNRVGNFSSEEDLLGKFYQCRALYIQGLSTLTQKLKDNLIRTRCKQELKDAIKLIGIS